MKPVALGIIGCGVIGRRHLSALTSAPVQSPGIEVIAVADLNRKTACNVAKEFGITTFYDSPVSLISDPRVEGIVLAIPTAGRSELALRTFAHHKHVLLEKPAAMNRAELLKMNAERGNLVAGCCSSRFRFLESAAIISDFIAAGHLGEIRQIRCRATKAASLPPASPPPAWRLNRSMNGGGILVNWGCYDLDYLLGITGWSLKPRVVLAQTWPIPPQLSSHIAPGSDAETHYTALIRCENGAAISLERSEYATARPEEVWQIIGDAGSLHLNMLDEPKKTLTFESATAEKGLISQVIWEGNETASRIHYGPILDFGQAIREKRSPKTSLEQSLIIQTITDAIYASATQGRAVEIDKN